MTQLDNTTNTNKNINKSEQQQLLKSISKRLNVFGSQGHYKKPFLTTTGKTRKNNEYIYPHKYELLAMFKNVYNGDYNAKEIHNTLMAFNDEYVGIKNKIAS